MTFEVHSQDPESGARTGTLSLPRGQVSTPVFMPIGTAGAVKALAPRDLQAEGIGLILGNTYHLHLRPGENLIAKAGGLQAFMGWEGLILTDSGGFQAFSLPNKTFTEDGIRFKHEITGQEVFLTPEKSIEIQRDLGSDICMVLDVVVPHPCDFKDAREGMTRTLRWAERCQQVRLDDHQRLFAIVQGSTYEALRAECAVALREMDFPGYAIGGVSVGEGLDLLTRVVNHTAPFLPEDKPRYAMGVGMPHDILNCIEAGVDMFDCVIPTRYARSGVLFTNRGRIRITRRQYRRDFYPIEPNSNNYASRTFTRAYIHHLFQANEILGTILASLHNVSWYHELMTRARAAIEKGEFTAFKQAFLDEFYSGDPAGKGHDDGAAHEPSA